MGEETNLVHERAPRSQRIVVLEPLLRDVDRRADPMRVPKVDRNNHDVLRKQVDLHPSSASHAQATKREKHGTFFVQRCTPWYPLSTVHLLPSLGFSVNLA